MFADRLIHRNEIFDEFNRLFIYYIGQRKTFFGRSAKNSPS